MRAAAELGIRTIAIHSQEDRFSLHRTKADESYLVGEGKGPIEAYLDIPDIIRIATEARADAVHPGYGFLSESPEFAEACAAANIVFVGPLPETMRRLGNKVEARNLAASAGVAVMPATPPLPADDAQVLAMAHAVGFPVSLKVKNEGEVPAGDPRFAARLRVLVDAGRTVGRVLAALCNEFNPERIVVGGELALAGDFLLDSIEESIRRYAIPDAVEDLSIVAGQLGDRAELMGALALVVGQSERVLSGRLKVAVGR